MFAYEGFMTIKSKVDNRIINQDSYVVEAPSRQEAVFTIMKMVEASHHFKSAPELLCYFGRVYRIGRC